MKYQPYHGEPFQRDCEGRYAPIRDALESYNRPFSVLDIGANYGWFGHRIVEDFPNAVYFGIDNKTIDPHERIYHIPRHVHESQLCDLSRSESFDVVLALSVVHHFEDPMLGLNAIKRLGEQQFIEIPNPEESKARGAKSLQAIWDVFRDYEPVSWSPSHLADVQRPTYLISQPPFITEQSLDAAYRGATGYATYKIVSDESDKFIEIDRAPFLKRKEVRDFVPGMNLHNFRLLGGSHPDPKSEGHPDDFPWNYILSLEGAVPIDDFHGKGYRK